MPILTEKLKKKKLLRDILLERQQLAQELLAAKELMEKKDFLFQSAEYRDKIVDLFEIITIK